MRKILILLFILTSFSLAQNLNEKFDEAIQLFNTGNLAESEKILRNLAEIIPESDYTLASVYYYLGEINFQSEKYFEASLDFENYLYRFPLDINIDKALIKLGLIYFKLEQYNKSISYFEKLLIDFPQNERRGFVEFWLGECYFKLNNFVKAEFYYLESIAHKSTNSAIDNSLFSLGFLYEQRSLFERSELYYDRVLFEYPKSPLTPIAIVRVSNSYYRLGRYQKAISRLTDKSLNQLPPEDLVEPTYLLANCYYRTGDYKKAEEEFRKIINKYPYSNVYRPSKYGYAWSLYQQNEIEKAHSVLTELKKGTDSLAERSMFWVGYFSRYLKQNDRAVNEFKEYIDTYPVYRLADNAKYEIGMIYYLERRYNEAEKFLFPIYDNSRNPEIKAKTSLVLGIINLERRNFPAAKIYFESAVSALSEDDKDFSVAMLSLALVNYYLNNFELAKNYLTTLSRKDKIHEPDKVYFYLAESYFSLKDFNRATLNYELAIKQSKSDTLIRLARYGLIYANYNMRNYPAVIEGVNNYLKFYPKDRQITDLKLRLADSYYAMKNFDKASEIYREFFSSRVAGRGSDYAAYQYAQALYKSGNKTAALEEFRSFPARFPSSKYLDETQYVLAWIYFQMRDYDMSIAEYFNFLEKFPQSPLIPLVYYGLGDSYFNKGDYQTAIKYYTEILEKYKNTDYVIDAINGIQYSYLAMGRVNEAASVISNFVYQNPGLNNLDKLFIKKGDIYFSHRDFTNAIQSYKEFIATFPRSPLVPFAHFSIAKSCVQLKSYPEALHNLSIIFNNYKESDLFDDAILESGLIYLTINEFDNAIKLFNWLISLPNSKFVAEGNYWKAKSFQKMDRINEALECYNIIINNYKDNPFYSRSLFEVGKIYYENKRFDDAYNLFKNVVELRNDEFAAESQFLMGEILFSQGKYNDAIVEYLKLKFAFPGHFELLVKGLFKAAESYEKLNEKQKAKDYYKEVLSYDSKSDLGKEAKKRISRIK